MTIEFLWQVPTSGDARFANADKTLRGERAPGQGSPYGPSVTDPRGQRFNYFDHLHQVARAAELARFDGIQVRQDDEGDESWIVAGYLARSTRTLKIVAEFDAARGSAVYAAKNAVSYQRFSGGRFAWQIGTGGDTERRHRNGDFADEADINPRIDEFLTVARHVITQTSYSFKGRFFEVFEGGFKGPLSNQNVPLVYLSGQSEQAYQLSARQADVHVLEARPLVELAQQVDKLQALARDAGRKLGIGLRIDVLARETEQEAIADAQRHAQQSAQATRPAAGDLLWPGLFTAVTGATATLVGSYAQVIDQLAAFAEAGVDSFLLGATPSLEEAYRVGEHILPPLRTRINSAERRAA